MALPRINVGAAALAAVGTPFAAGARYLANFGQTAISLNNPVNRFQNLAAMATPFTAEFSRMYSLLNPRAQPNLPGGGTVDIRPIVSALQAVQQAVGTGLTTVNASLGGVNRQITTGLGAVNTQITQVARDVPRLIQSTTAVRQETASTGDAARENTVKSGQLLQITGEIRDLIVRGAGPRTPNQPTPGAPPQSEPETLQAILVSINKQSTQQQQLFAALIRAVSGVKSELDEGDAFAGLRSARDADESRVTGNQKIGPFWDGAKKDEKKEGGGFWSSLLLGGLGGMFARWFGPTSAIGRALAGLGGLLSRALAPLGRLALGAAGALGLSGLFGRGAAVAATAAGARGATVAAGAAAARVGARGLLGFAGRAIIPGFNFAQAGIQASQGNYVGAGVSALGGLASFIPIPVIREILSIGLGTAGAMINRDTSRNVVASIRNSFGMASRPDSAGGQGAPFSAAALDTRSQRIADARVQQLATASNAAPAPAIQPAPTIIQHINQAPADQGPPTVIAQNPKSIVDKSRGELFSYIS